MPFLVRPSDGSCSKLLYVSSLFHIWPGLSCKPNLVNTSDNSWKYSLTTVGFSTLHLLVKMPSGTRTVSSWWWFLRLVNQSLPGTLCLRGFFMFMFWQRRPTLSISWIWLVPNPSTKAAIVFSTRAPFMSFGSTVGLPGVTMSAT